MTTLGKMGEHEAIRRLTAMLGMHADLTVGAGDDCAVVKLPAIGFDQVFTTDPVVEGVHFLKGEKPERIGNKAVGRVLSDMAAMGAQPQWILVNVVAPADLEFSVLEGIYSGIGRLCGQFGATVIGGDLAKGPVLELHVFGTGILPSGTALLRSGAKVGDRIFVTGKLGDSFSGKHLDFTPRVSEGIWLRESGLVHSMMDLSDGLATDLRHILKQSGAGAEIAADLVPKNGTLEQALFDGEDFELLLTAAPENTESLKTQWAQKFDSELFEIGGITENTGELALTGSGKSRRILTDKAFEHFQTEGGKNE